MTESCRTSAIDADAIVVVLPERECIHRCRSITPGTGVVNRASPDSPAVL